MSIDARVATWFHNRSATTAAKQVFVIDAFCRRSTRAVPRNSCFAVLPWMVYASGDDRGGHHGEDETSVTRAISSGRVPCSMKTRARRCVTLTVGVRGNDDHQNGQVERRREHTGVGENVATLPWTADLPGVAGHPAAGGNAERTHVEHGVAIIGMNLDVARAIGRDFGQDAIFCWTRAHWQIVACDSAAVVHRRWSIISTGDQTTAFCP